MRCALQVETEDSSEEEPEKLGKFMFDADDGALDAVVSGWKFKGMGGAAHRPDPRGILTGMDAKIRKRIKGAKADESEGDGSEEEEESGDDDGDDGEMDGDDSEGGGEDEDDDDKAHESDEEDAEDGTVIDKHGARPDEEVGLHVLKSTFKNPRYGKRAWKYLW
jgi:hypothetical protein